MQNCLAILALTFQKLSEEHNKYASNFFQPLWKFIDLPTISWEDVGDALTCLVNYYLSDRWTQVLSPYTWRNIGVCQRNASLKPFFSPTEFVTLD